MTLRRIGQSAAKLLNLGQLVRHGEGSTTKWEWLVQHRRLDGCFVAAKGRQTTTVLRELRYGLISGETQSCWVSVSLLSGTWLCDGDQMNTFPPHSTMAIAEAQLLSHVSNWFTSTKHSGPCNGQVQDSNTGAFELTRNHIVIDKYHAMMLFQNARVIPEYKQSMYTGRDMISLLLEKEAPINLKRTPAWFDENYAPYLNYLEDEIEVIIKNGKLLKGVLDAKTVGEGSIGGVFHLIAKEFGVKKTLEMLFSMQQITLEALCAIGFTLGAGDFQMSKAKTHDVNQIVSECLKSAELNTRKLLRGELIPPIGMTTRQFFEASQIECLKTPDTMFNPLLTSIAPNYNGLMKMIAIKTKGKIQNMIHIRGMVGQVKISGARMEEKFGFRRTLPYFPRFSTDPAAYGFVKNNYMRGLANYEYVFGAMAGRFDLITKSLSTASTGYLNRKSMCLLQSLIANNLRQSTKDLRIVQYLYGDDGLDARAVEPVKFLFVTMNDETLKAAYSLETKMNDEITKLAEAQVKRIKRHRDTYRAIFMRLENIFFNRLLNTSNFVPVNVQRMLDNVLADTVVVAKPTADDILENFRIHAELRRDLPYAFLNDIQRKLQRPIPDRFTSAVTFQIMIIDAVLGPKVLTTLAPGQMKWMSDKIMLTLSRALIDYGTCIGMIASQTISEPLTQWLLDSHHRSVTEGTKKGGLTRFNEIVGAIPIAKEQSAEMLLRVKPEYEHSQMQVQEIANNIESMIFNQFVTQFHILCERYGELRYPPLMDDEVWIKEFDALNPRVRRPINLTFWCLWYSLDKASMILKGLTLETIVRELTSQCPALYIIHTPENTADIRIRIYIQATAFRRGSENDEVRVAEVNQKILATTLRGVAGIKSVKVVKKIMHRIQPDGGLIRCGEKGEPEVFAIRTTGTNLPSVAANNRIATEHINSTSIGDTYRLLGIEATRSKVVSELKTFIGDKAPNMRHIMLYADEMCTLGKFSSLERAGLEARERNNTLLKMCSFAPVQKLKDAALSGNVNKIYGVDAPLTLGRVPFVGSLYNEVVMDDEFLAENTESLESTLDKLLS